MAGEGSVWLVVLKYVQDQDGPKEELQQCRLHRGPYHYLSNNIFLTSRFPPDSST